MMPAEMWLCRAYEAGAPYVDAMPPESFLDPLHQTANRKQVASFYGSPNYRTACQMLADERGKRITEIGF
jgi:hypothetical protein